MKVEEVVEVPPLVLRESGNRSMFPESLSRNNRTTSELPFRLALIKDIGNFRDCPSLGALKVVTSLLGTAKVAAIAA